MKPPLKTPKQLITEERVAQAALDAATGDSVASAKSRLRDATTARKKGVAEWRTYHDSLAEVIENGTDS